MNVLATVLIAAMCLLVGMLVGAELRLKTGSLNACRAANPGYECVVGWVRGEAFE